MAAKRRLPSKQVHFLLHFWSGSKKPDIRNKRLTPPSIPDVRPFSDYRPFGAMTCCSVRSVLILLSLFSIASDT